MRLLNIIGGILAVIAPALASTYLPGLKSLSNLPARFEATRDGRGFSGKGFGYKVDVSASGYRMKIADTAVVAVAIAGANQNAPAQAIQKAAVKTNYLLGHAANWRTNVDSFERVDYHGILPGIDVAYYSNSERHFEFDLIVGAGVDPRELRLQYVGQDHLDLDSEGNLVIHAGGRQIVQQSPAVYQRLDGSVRLVSARYAIAKDGSVGFVMGPYDRSKSLIIDPSVVRSSFLSGTGTDTAIAVARDSKGFIYVAGTSRSSDITGTDGSGQPNVSGDLDIFLMKINPTNPAGQDLVYLTFFGGTGTDDLKAMALDAAGAVYLTGSTNSLDFPTRNASQGKVGGGTDAYLVKIDLNQSGSDALVYSTYVGGADVDIAYGLAVDKDGNAFIAGYTASIDFPMAGNPVQGSNAGGWDAFVAEFNSSGSLAFSTYLGGDKTDNAEAIALAADGTVIIMGKTLSASFPIAGNAYDTNYHGGGDVFVARLKLNVGLNGLLYGTYLGGSGTEEPRAMALTADGKVVITGSTLSTDFPVVGAFQAQKKATTDVFVSVLDLTQGGASALTYSTFLGGASSEIAYDVKMDRAGMINVAGYTLSADFPTTPQAWQPGTAGGTDAFVTKLDPSRPGADSLVYSTYIGGAQTDLGYGLMIDDAGAIYVVGSTTSRKFPATSDTTRDTYPGDYDAFIIGFQPCTFTISPSGKSIDAAGGDVTITVSTTNDCIWSPVTAAPWVTVKDAGSARGNGAATITAAANPGDARSADISVGDRTFSLLQAAKQ